MPLKNKINKTKTDEFSIILTTSKQKPLKIESDRGTEFHNSIFQNLLKVKNIHHYFRFTDKVPSIAERFKRTVRNLSKKRVFIKSNADWLSDLSSVVKQYNNTIHISIKMTPIQASKKSNEKVVYNNLRDDREKQKPKSHLSQLVRTSDIKRVFSKSDSTNWSFILNTISEFIHDTIRSYRINYLPERYKENLLLLTKLSLDENNQVMKNQNLIQ